MKRYLIINHYGETYQIEMITTEFLVKNKKGHIQLIIDLQNKTFFDHENNVWLPVPERE